MKKKHFEEIEVNGNLYSGTYYETETRSDLAWDEWHLSNLESVEIELVTVQKYNPDFDTFKEVTHWSHEVEITLKARLGAY